MSGFHVGQMVVAIGSDDATEDFRQRGGKRPGGVAYPTRGLIYTIRGIRPCSDNHAALVVEEIINPVGPGGFEWDFDSRCFRPVKETSIEIFRKLVAPMPFSVWQTGEREN